LWLAAGVAAALVGGGGVASAGATTSSFITADGCVEHQAFVDGDAAAVSERLPKSYTPVLDSSTGRPLLFARAEHCQQVTLNGRPTPGTEAGLRGVLQTPGRQGWRAGRPGGGPVQGELPPLCNWYTLFWLADKRRIVEWLHHGTAGFPAVYVPHMVFELGAFDPPQDGAPFHFEAPAPAPSPFSIDDIGRERPGEIPV